MREVNLGREEFFSLSVEIIGKGGTFSFKARGSSMYPFIRDGDILTIAPIETTALQVGDVAFYRNDSDGLIAHRVVGRNMQDGRTTLLIRGDRGSFEYVDPEHVLGRVISVQRPLNPTITQNHRFVRKFLDSLREEGPLAAIRRVNIFIKYRLCRSIDRFRYIVQHYFERAFDMKYGTDTSGAILIEDLAIESKNIRESSGYHPTSIKLFKQIMNLLTINFSEFEFIDFGSGKGRVLLLASQYGFNKINGVEFSPVLHLIATKNITIYERYTGKPGKIESICMDAAEFPIPNAPLVCFFYSPFNGKVMRKVFDNVLTSYVVTPREIVLALYGESPEFFDETLRMFKATKFQCRELKLHGEWWRSSKYHGFLITSPKTS
ncbi:MAG TPA: hypothetical protein DCP92_07070 [Nitrospiraceae bacterium]|jgi:signal peptidase I|nr:hypothetical protein [Nitrospiraceae bacterium]